MIVDLRSDTVTKPSVEMKSAMLDAPLGDDVFGEDPTVNALQEYAANLFGMENALYCSSGTQTNQIAINVHTRPGDEIICHPLSHVYLYEGGGIAQNSGCSVRFINGERGLFKMEDIGPAINNPLDVHLPLSRLVCVEDTMNKGGGAIWDLEELRKISAYCREKKLSLHCDGARLFNSLVVSGTEPAAYGQLFDTISICLSKGLGAPVGSILLGSNDFIQRARRRRKSMGGGMRQVGVIAAAGLYAIKNNIPQLREDHRKAQILKHQISECSFIKEVLPVETNIIIFKLSKGITAEQIAEKLREKGILCMPFGTDHIRMVLHLDITDSMLEYCSDALKKIN